MDLYRVTVTSVTVSEEVCIAIYLTRVLLWLLEVTYFLQIVIPVVGSERHVGQISSTIDERK